MAIELYWGSGSPFAWRALLALEWKKIPYTSKLIEFSKGEHKAPNFLAMNPRGKVPVMKDGDVALYEALAIVNYLERKHPEPPLLGRSLAETSRIWREISECIYYLETPVFNVVFPVFFGGVEGKGEEIKAAAANVHAELDRLNKNLTTQDWVAGANASAADIWFYPEIMLVERAASKDNVKSLDLGLSSIGTRYPAIGRWKVRMESQPGYERTYPPHWKQAA